MNETCVIKSHKNGITLVLDPEIPYEKLVEDICVKFATTKAFFGNAQLSLALEGRELTDQEISVIIEAIELNSEIKIMYYKNEDVFREADFLSLDAFSHATIIPHSVANEDTIDSDLSVIILGDVKRFASVRSKGNVIVLGSLQGDVEAGYEQEEGDHYIIASKVEADVVTIDGNTDEVVIHHRNLRIGRKAVDPIVIRYWNGQMHAESLSSGFLSQN